MSKFSVTTDMFIKFSKKHQKDYLEKFIMRENTFPCSFAFTDVLRELLYVVVVICAFQVHFHSSSVGILFSQDPLYVVFNILFIVSGNYYSQLYSK